MFGCVRCVCAKPAAYFSTRRNSRIEWDYEMWNVLIVIDDGVKVRAVCPEEQCEHRSKGHKRLKLEKG